MTTVAPSAPAPVAPDAASQGKGESADPAAFAAEFESALTSLVSATALPADTTAAELPVDSPLAPELLAGAAVVPAALPAPAAALAAVPAPALPLSGTQDTSTPSSAEPVDENAPTPQVAFVPDAAASLSATVAAATAEPAADDDTADGAPDAPADATPDAPVLAGPAPGLAPLVVPAPLARIADAPVAASAPTTAAAVTATSATDAAAPAARTPLPAADAAAPVAAPPVAPPAVATVQAPDEVAAPAAPARAQAPDLVGQLSRPLGGLRSFGDGTHVISITITPENLGPVAVRAHVSGDSLRIELVAPTDQARAAIKDILPDLRRDLSGSGGQTTLDLSSGNQPSGRDSAPRDAPYSGRGGDAVAAAPAAGIRTASRSDAGLDVLA